MKPRIIGAFLVGAGLVGAAFFYAPGINHSANADASVGVVVATAPSRTYVPITDTNDDGVPDWEEAFRSTAEPLITVEDLTATFTPDTLTEQAGIQLFEQAIRARMAGPFGASDEEIVNASFAQIAEKAEDYIYSEKDITIDDTTYVDSAYARSYFNSVAAILLQDTEPTKNEMALLSDALNTNDPAFLDKMAINEAGYKRMRDAMLAITVPREYTKLHLDLTNTYNALYEDIKGMRMVYDDPLYALLRVKRYEDDATGLYFAFRNYDNAIQNASFVVTPDDAASVFSDFNQ